MSTQEAAVGLSSVISLLGLASLLFWGYRAYRIDAFRQGMFAVRDEMFDFARRSNFAFNDPAYGMLRDTMNGYIRFGHKLSLLHVLLFAATARRDAATRSHALSFDGRWLAVTEELPTVVRAELLRFRDRMDRLVVRHMILNSPLLMALVIPALVALFLAEVCAVWLVRVFRSELDEIDTAALAYGEI